MNHSRELFPYFVLAGGALAIVVKLIQGYNVHNDLQNRAEQIAVAKYGDGQEPLTKEERLRWYDEIGAGVLGPSKSQLEKFLNQQTSPSPEKN
ncbi:MAG: hypothetical protein WC533_01630 [Candidatus Pacearchaeota archaeon]